MMLLTQGKYEYLPKAAPTARYVMSPYTTKVVMDIFIIPKDMIAALQRTVIENKNGLKNGINPNKSIAKINTIEIT